MWLRLVVEDSLNELSERASSSQNICCRFIENTSSQCNQWSKSLVLPFLMTPQTSSEPFNEFVFHWFGLHIKSPSDYWAIQACTETMLSHFSPWVCWSGNLTYIFIHQPGHGSVLYWTEVITVRNTRQPGLVDRTSVCIYVYYYCTMPGQSCFKKNWIGYCSFVSAGF